MKKVQLTDAMNTYNPALEVLIKKGYTISIINIDEDSFQWKATKKETNFIAFDPLRLLALVTIYEIKGNNWNKVDEKYYDDILDMKSN